MSYKITLKYFNLRLNLIISLFYIANFKNSKHTWYPILICNYQNSLYLEKDLVDFLLRE